MEDIEGEGKIMGYLNESHGYGDAGEENYVNPFEAEGPGRVHPAPSIELLQEAVKLRQQELSRAKYNLTECNSKVNHLARELREAKARLEKAKAPAVELARKLRDVHNFGVVLFTTDTGHTYAALRAGLLWYVTQNGKAHPKPPMGSLQLAKMIGKSSVRIATQWRTL